MEPFLAAGGLKPKDVDFHYAKATQDRFTALISAVPTRRSSIRRRLRARERKASPTSATSTIT